MTRREKWQKRMNLASSEWKLAHPKPKKDAKKWSEWQEALQLFLRGWQSENPPPPLTKKEETERKRGQDFLDAMSGLMRDIL